MNLVSEPRVCVVIPARIDSLRFPGKVLWKLHDMPMIEHVYKRACMAFDSQDVYITSGDLKILSYVESIGANVIQSSLEHNDGTSRVAEAAVQLNYEYVVILQADEILIDPEHLFKLCESIKLNPGIKYWNLITNLNSESELDDLNVVKCAINIHNEILFMFRQNPLIIRDHKIFKKIMGTVVIERSSLLSLKELVDTPLQNADSIEQLKIIEYGNKILGVNVKNGYPSVNSISDISKVKMYIEANLNQKDIIGRYV